MIIYKPFCASLKNDNHVFSTDMQWQKITSFVTHSHAQCSPYNIQSSNGHFELKSLRLDKYFSIFVSGIHPRLIIKSTTSLPICLDVKNLELMSMTSFHTPKCERGFIYLGKNVSQNDQISYLISKLWFTSFIYPQVHFLSEN